MNLRSSFYRDLFACFHRSSPRAGGLTHPGGKAAASSEFGPWQRGPGARDQRALEETPGVPWKDRSDHLHQGAIPLDDFFKAVAATIKVWKCWEVHLHVPGLRKAVKSTEISGEMWKIKMTFSNKLSYLPVHIRSLSWCCWTHASLFLQCRALRGRSSGLRGRSDRGGPGIQLSSLPDDPQQHTGSRGPRLPTAELPGPSCWPRVRTSEPLPASDWRSLEIDFRFIFPKLKEMHKRPVPPNSYSTDHCLHLHYFSYIIWKRACFLRLSSISPF